MLAQRAASEGPRWTRAVEDPSVPIPKEVAGDLRKISGAARPSFLLAEAARSECAASMRAVKDSLAVPLRAKWRKSATVPAVLSWEVSLTRVQKFMTMLKNRHVGI